MFGMILGTETKEKTSRQESAGDYVQYKKFSWQAWSK